MRYETIKRSDDAFQQAVSIEQIEAMSRRAFGANHRVVSAVECGNGMYNSTYRVELDGVGSVILRVAPSPERQFRVERELMRNEHASIPYLAPIAALMPRTLAVDFTHAVIGRDYMFQTLLPGVPASEGLGAYDRAEWAGFFRQLGEIVKRIQEVRGSAFGPVREPRFVGWGDSVIASLSDAVADMEDASLDAKDAQRLVAAAEAHRAVFDEITVPRLLHEDLWTVNVMIDASASRPTITGVFDCDRTSWGDPDSDWSVLMAARKPGTERDAFWESYGPRPATSAAVLRQRFYLARNTARSRLEFHRLRRAEDAAATYPVLRELLKQLENGNTTG
jgi:aminoglycoside phosphotransferase (APT) family kinase protein